MYIAGRGHEHAGPGTALTLFTSPNHRGMGGCGCDKYSGMGLFESGTDFTQWGWPEWGITILGGYMLLSTVFTTKRAVGRVRALPGERRKKRAAALRKEASELSKKKSGWF